MKTISEIYSEYKIMPNLQEHMLRVTAVAYLICDNFTEQIDKENTIIACLLHDMGNIIKAKLDYFPEFLKPEELPYWNEVKKEYTDKYKNEHIASEMIAKEIGVSEKAFTFLKNIGFSKCTKNEIENIFEHKICNYSDLRVGPYGVLPLEERISEAHKRYQGRSHDVGQTDTFEPLSRSIRNIEKQIFDKCLIKPEDITDETIAPIIESLRNFVIK